MSVMMLNVLVTLQSQPDKSDQAIHGRCVRVCVLYDALEWVTVGFTEDVVNPLETEVKPSQSDSAASVLQTVTSLSFLQKLLY